MFKINKTYNLKIPCYCFVKIDMSDINIDGRYVEYDFVFDNTNNVTIIKKNKRRSELEFIVNRPINLKIKYFVYIYEFDSDGNKVIVDTLEQEDSFFPDFIVERYKFDNNPLAEEYDDSYEAPFELTYDKMWGRLFVPEDVDVFELPYYIPARMDMFGGVGKYDYTWYISVDKEPVYSYAMMEYKFDNSNLVKYVGRQDTEISSDIEYLYKIYNTSLVFTEKRRYKDYINSVDKYREHLLKKYSNIVPDSFDSHFILKYENFSNITNPIWETTINKNNYITKYIEGDEYDLDYKFMNLPWTINQSHPKSMYEVYAKDNILSMVFFQEEIRAFIKCVVVDEIGNVVECSKNINIMQKYNSRYTPLTLGMGVPSRYNFYLGSYRFKTEIPDFKVSLITELVEKIMSYEYFVDMWYWRWKASDCKAYNSFNSRDRVYISSKVGLISLIFEDNTFKFQIKSENTNSIENSISKIYNILRWVSLLINEPLVSKNDFRRTVDIVLMAHYDDVITNMSDHMLNSKLTKYSEMELDDLYKVIMQEVNSFLSLKIEHDYYTDSETMFS